MQQTLRTNFTPTVFLKGLHAVIQMHTCTCTHTRAVEQTGYSSCDLPFISFGKTSMTQIWECISYCVTVCVWEGQNKSYFLFPLWEIVSCQRFKGCSHPRTTGFVTEKEWCSMYTQLKALIMLPFTMFTLLNITLWWQYVYFGTSQDLFLPQYCLT